MTESDELDGAIQAARSALGPPPAEPLSAALFRTPPESDPGPACAVARSDESSEPAVGPAPALPTGVPIWDALGALKSLLDLVPASPAEPTRMGQCVAKMRAHFQRDAFPDAAADRPVDDFVSPLSYPRLELNRAVARAGPVILGVLDRVEIEGEVRELLARELKKPTPFLEEDDRGTVGGIVEPTGLTKEQQRNDWKLNALARFLDALRRRPYAAVSYAFRLLRAVAIPDDLLSIDLAKNTVTFRGKPYKVSDPTCHFIAMLLAAGGQIVSTGDVKKELQARGLWEDGQLRSDRLKKGLPPELLSAIVTGRRGSRLDVDLLLSHV